MPITHKLEFGIYHWDTFDDITVQVGEADTLEEAKEIVVEKYKGHLFADGADKIEIVDSGGNVVKRYKLR